MLSKFYQKYNIYIIASLMSIVMSLIVLSYNQPFNADGLLYLKTAKAFSQHGFKAAMAIYGWPFYSILIAITAKLTNLSFLHSAYLLNIILDTLTVLFFVAITKELGGSRRIQIIAAFIILFYPRLSHFRDTITRGHGYYAFALLSMLLLIKYFRNYKWRYAISWGIAIVVASCFRIEGTCLAIFAPLILLFKPNEHFFKKVKYIIKAYVVQFFILICIATYILLLPHHNTQPSLGRLSQIHYQIFHGAQRAWVQISERALLIKTHIFSLPDNRANGFLFLAAGYLAYYLNIVISTTGVLYSILFIYAIKQKTIVADWSAKAVWLVFVLSSLFVTFLFLFQMNFITSRYIELLCLTLLLPVPFALDRIYFNWKNRKSSLTGSRWLFPIIILWLLVMTVGAVGHFGPSKTYRINASKWLIKHTPKNSVLCTNDWIITYFTKKDNIIKFYFTPKQLYFLKGRRGLFVDLINSKTVSEKLNQCDYISLQVSRHDHHSKKTLNKIIKRQPIKIFHNRRGARVFIFRNPIKT